MKKITKIVLMACFLLLLIFGIVYASAPTKIDDIIIRGIMQIPGTIETNVNITNHNLTNVNHIIGEGGGRINFV